MRLFRTARIALCAVVAAAVSGCIQSSTVIKMKPDGSGTIEETMTMSAEALAQFSAMAAMGSDKDHKNSKNPMDDVFSDKDARAQAAKMGQGVTFVSSEKIDTPDRKGMKAIYAFTDIRKITLQELNAPGGMNGDAAGMTSGTQKDQPMTFQFTQLPGGDGLLTIAQPGVEKAMNSTPAKSKSDAAADPMAQQGLEMMKTLMKGLKVDVVVQVPRLVKTNSAYVSGGNVTLLSMDFDQVLADPAALQKMNDAKSLDDTKALLKGVKGIKVNLEPKLTIEFAGK